MLQRASGSPLTHPGRPPAASGGLGYLVPDLNSGPSEGHLNMRADQCQVGPLGYNQGSRLNAGNCSRGVLAAGEGRSGHLKLKRNTRMQRL